MRDSMLVAKYVIDYCTKTGNPISNLQLQKILYYIQLNFYRNFKKPCFEENSFEAWEYGPVVPKVYRLFCSYGAAKICNVYSELGQLFINVEKELCEKVINTCVNMDVWDLVQRSHKEGSPWKQVYRDRHELIPENLMRDYAMSMQ